MPKTLFTKPYLRRLRNEIDIALYMSEVLHIEHRCHDGTFRFLCPQCGEFHTAANRKTNLARCFRCQKNYNPIDITMRVKCMDFREAVDWLSDYLDTPHLRRCTEPEEKSDAKT